jgi:small-conductance mechanosensitive channel
MGLVTPSLTPSQSSELANTKMPIPIISHVLAEGLSVVPHVYTVFLWVAIAGIVALLKYYYGGARNTSERLMHSKVVMVTVCLGIISTRLYI